MRGADRERQSIKYIHVQSLQDVKAFITLASSEVAIVTGLLYG